MMSSRFQRARTCAHWVAGSRFACPAMTERECAIRAQSVELQHSIEISLCAAHKQAMPGR